MRQLLSLFLAGFTSLGPLGSLTLRAQEIPSAPKAMSCCCKGKVCICGHGLPATPEEAKAMAKDMEGGASFESCADSSSPMALSAAPAWERSLAQRLDAPALESCQSLPALRFFSSADQRQQLRPPSALPS